MDRKHKLVKICGLTDPENIKVCAGLKPDLIGLIFYELSPRFVKGNALASWFRERGNILPETVRKVGVFVREDIGEIISRCLDFDLHYIQLHGNETQEYVHELLSKLKDNQLKHIQIIKAFGISESFDFKETVPFNIFCSHFLFDTKTEMKGGSGKKFPWSKLDEYRGDIPFILSGGIGPDDLGELEKLSHPAFAGIDLNSKFEIYPGVKDRALLEDFFCGFNEFRTNSKF